MSTLFYDHIETITPEWSSTRGRHHDNPFAHQVPGLFPPLTHCLSHGYLPFPKQLAHAYAPFSHQLPHDYPPFSPQQPSVSPAWSTDDDIQRNVPHHEDFQPQCVRADVKHNVSYPTWPMLLDQPSEFEGQKVYYLPIPAAADIRNWLHFGYIGWPEPCLYGSNFRSYTVSGAFTGFAGL